MRDRRSCTTIFPNDLKPITKRSETSARARERENQSTALLVCMVNEREMFEVVEENLFPDRGLEEYPMEEILSAVFRGCEMARRLETNLPGIASRTQVIRASCQEIAAVFSAVAERLSSQSVSPTSGFDVRAMFGEHSPEALRDGGGGYVLGPMDLLGGRGAVPLQEEGPSFYPPDVEMNAADLGNIGCAASAGRVSAAEATAMAVARGGLGGGEEGVAVELAESSRRATWSSSAGKRASRKRRDSSETRTIRVPAPRTGNLDVPPDDGYTWRKYGQKDILNAKFPRSYYRCTHRSFYGCDAKKQVQRLDNDPFTYEVTYCGDHTCQTSPTPLVLPPINVASPQQQQLPPAPPILSTSINLGSWLASGDFGGGIRNAAMDVAGMREGQGGSSSQARSGGGRVGYVECPVADLADAMFNSAAGVSGSMDAIFASSSSSTKHHE